MQWASTVKEVELSHFFKEWPAMWKRFWDIWIVSWVIILGVGFMASPLVPYGYRITNFTCILPIMTQACCHFLYPIVLNPWCKSLLGTTRSMLISSAALPILDGFLGFQRSYIIDLCIVMSKLDGTGQGHARLWDREFICETR